MVIWFSRKKEKKLFSHLSLFSLQMKNVERGGSDNPNAIFLLFNTTFPSLFLLLLHLTSKVFQIFSSSSGSSWQEKGRKIYPGMSVLLPANFQFAPDKTWDHYQGDLKFQDRIFFRGRETAWSMRVRKQTRIFWNEIDLFSNLAVLTFL